MKTYLGLFMIIVGVVLGLYVGVWLCFAGGIISVVHGLQANPMGATAIALGFVRIVCAGLAGMVSAFVLIVPGLALVCKD